MSRFIWYWGGERAPLRPQAPPPFGTRGRAGKAPVDEPFHLVLGGSERRSAPRPPHRSERVAELARLRQRSRFIWYWGGERAPLRPQAPPPFGTRGRAGKAPVDEPFHLVLGGSERRSAPRPPHR